MKFAIIFAVLLCGSVSAQADLVVLNANIRTMSEKAPRVEAFAVKANRISAVGTTKRIKALVGEHTVVIDAGARLILPGFNGSHVHFMPLGNTFSSIDLSRSGAPEAAIIRLAEYAGVLPNGRWILGSGWNGTAFPAERLNRATSRNPLFIYAVDGRSALVNQMAGKLAGISTANGIVSGPSLEVVRLKVPKDHTRNFAEIAETASNVAAVKGVTSVHDTNADDHTPVYRQLEREGRLKTRIYDCVSLRDWQTVIERNDTEMVRGGCLKDFWEMDDERIDQLRIDIGAADKAGLQVLIHAIGSRANDVVLGIFEDVIKANGKSPKRRFRIEHAHGVRPDDFVRFARSGIIASIQPHLFQSAFRSNSGNYDKFYASGVNVAFGSDAAMTDLDPLLGIHAAVNFGNISVEQAVMSYTFGSAFAEHQESVKGSIDIGKLADFVILSKDIFTIDKMLIKETKVMLTAVNGQVVYKNWDHQ